MMRNFLRHRLPFIGSKGSKMEAFGFGGGLTPGEHTSKANNYTTY
jgi:hypothetical protein